MSRIPPGLSIRPEDSDSRGAAAGVAPHPTTPPSSSATRKPAANPIRYRFRSSMRPASGWANVEMGKDAAAEIKRMRHLSSPSVFYSAPPQRPPSVVILRTLETPVGEEVQQGAQDPRGQGGRHTRRRDPEWDESLIPAGSQQTCVCPIAAATRPRTIPPSESVEASSKRSLRRARRRCGAEAGRSVAAASGMSPGVRAVAEPVSPS